MIGNDFLAAQICKIISIARTHVFDHTVFQVSNEIGLTSKSLFVETPFLLDQVSDPKNRFELFLIRALSYEHLA